MTKEELFKKYDINETHSQWDEGIDSWYSVEIYRLMHGGKLPDKEDLSSKYVVDFLDKCKDIKGFMANFMKQNPNWGSYFLTAKRMLYMFSDDILKEINT